MSRRQTKAEREREQSWIEEEDRQAHEFRRQYSEKLLAQFRDWLDPTQGWLFLDTETTGLDDEDQVIEVAITKAATGEILLNTLIRPTCFVPPKATWIHGITDVMVAAAPTFIDVHPLIQSVIAGRRVIAYNARFDREKINGDCKRNGFPILLKKALMACAMEAYSEYVGCFDGSFGPDDDAKWLRLPGSRHRALSDCQSLRILILGILAPDGAQIISDFLEDKP